MQAIPTWYDGHLFRSRLEARWATFYNALNIPYEYEKEGYTDGGTCYLPDFYLPKQRYWVEIKGCIPDFDEQEKCLAFAQEHELYVCVGQIRPPWRGNWERGGWILKAEHDERWNYPSFQSAPYCWQLSGEGLYVIGPCHITMGDPNYMAIVAAYTKASSARFEYGEIGETRHPAA